ncbi:SGNH/GDSL hydrolase family protein [Echinicola jeungdonensis]|uniref:SGNH/GDSL hydrolase family protein n=1 Tax=Echinicola jeungdonensis TaxID=709343 RepID=A0ABV5J494_9BACT|nr:SGNH/GDSL hydrolase family protein [Echinicola jeungdonensis]MDN3670049.1 SGNH/GDSL hydrolase family protein [Echinicola jeungdonensis]
MKYLSKQSCFKIFLTVILLAGISISGNTQEVSGKFQEEVQQIVQKNPIPKQGPPVYLFTGSSSIRMWKDLSSYFPEIETINTGFGGSQTFELLHYSQELILQYQPKKIFIYEGDNDIAAGKKPMTILKTTKKLVTKIHQQLPDAHIILISPKPSLARWHLQEEYQNLNRLLEIYCQKQKQVSFANVWNIMLDENGQPKEDIFIEDGLHMNAKGYDLWAKVLKEFIP